jgi:hypothetical protein
MSTLTSNGKVCDDLGMPATFGIGTHFTNDFSAASDPSRQSKALNIVRLTVAAYRTVITTNLIIFLDVTFLSRQVIKLAVIEGRDAVKISDELSKVCSAFPLPVFPSPRPLSDSLTLFFARVCVLL